MTKTKFTALSALGLASLFCSSAMAEQGSYAGPAGGLSPEENKQIWNQYCEGYDDLSRAPGINWSNGQIMKAARVISKLSDYSLYYYSGPMGVYGLNKSTQVPADAANAATQAGFEITPNAYKFLVQLCGEFRDRASLVDEKLRWVADTLYLLPVTEQATLKGKDVKNVNIWSKVSAHSYQPYLQFSIKLFRAKEALVRSSGTAVMGKYNEQLPVPGQLVCETKYIFSSYISRKRTFTTLADYDKGYKTFAKSGCTSQDRDYYYDFRGDSNFKPYSPESNGMIWYISSLSRNCAAPNKAKAAAKEKGWITDAQCEAYYRNPFTTRYAAARAGLSAWLFRDQNLDATFGDEDSSVYIHPHYEATSKPFTFSFGNSADKYAFPRGFIGDWATSVAQGALYGLSDIGYDSVVDFASENKNYNIELTYERLRDAVNRHTDWYDSGFDDGMGLMRDQAYSPFVASSYEMSASDAFTAPGTTVQSPSDGRKHWMFVFKIHKDNWYNTSNIIDAEPVDFDRHWFDETSLGTNHLADHERAWDRLGSPLEKEYDSIIYLHNITTSGDVEEEGGEE